MNEWDCVYISFSPPKVISMLKPKEENETTLYCEQSSHFTFQWIKTSLDDYGVEVQPRGLFKENELSTADVSDGSGSMSGWGPVFFGYSGLFYRWVITQPSSYSAVKAGKSAIEEIVLPTGLNYQRLKSTSYDIFSNEVALQLKDFKKHLFWLTLVTMQPFCTHIFFIVGL